MAIKDLMQSYQESAPDSEEFGRRGGGGHRRRGGHGGRGGRGFRRGGGGGGGFHPVRRFRRGAHFFPRRDYYDRVTEDLGESAAQALENHLRMSGIRGVNSVIPAGTELFVRFVIPYNEDELPAVWQGYIVTAVLI